MEVSERRDYAAYVGRSDKLVERTNNLVKENIRRFAAGLPLLNVVDKKEGF